MNAHIILAVLAVGAFFLAAVDRDGGKGVPIGLLFLTLILVL